jgi:hypothetical protein
LLKQVSDRRDTERMGRVLTGQSEFPRRTPPVFGLD